MVDRTDIIYDGSVDVRGKKVVVAASASGDTVIVAAVPNKRICVLTGLLVPGSTVDFEFTSGLAGTSISGMIRAAAKTPFPIPYCPLGQFETEPGEALVLNQSSMTSTGGHLTYAEIS